MEHFKCTSDSGSSMQIWPSPSMDCMRSIWTIHHQAALHILVMFWWFKQIMYLAMMKPLLIILGKGASKPIWARVSPFHDITVWGGRLNCLEKHYFQQTHSGHYYACMIIIGRLCRIMWSRIWHNLPPQTLMVEIYPARDTCRCKQMTNYENYGNNLPL
jgi:hypothetical protein